MAYMDKMKHDVGDLRTAGGKIEYHIFYGPCEFCKVEQRVNVMGPEFYKYQQGAFIQDALTSNTPEEREFLISGMCSKCWDEMFPEEEKE